MNMIMSFEEERRRKKNSLGLLPSSRGGGCSAECGREGGRRTEVFCREGGEGRRHGGWDGREEEVLLSTDRDGGERAEVVQVGLGEPRGSWCLRVLLSGEQPGSQRPINMILTFTCVYKTQTHKINWTHDFYIYK